MKKILKLIALILALVLIVGIAGFADSLVGNPISNHLAVKGTESYLSAQYSHAGILAMGTYVEVRFACHTPYYIIYIICLDGQSSDYYPFLC